MNWLELLKEFWQLSEANVVWVLSGSILLGTTSGVLGCFSFLRKRSLVGDALAHAALPGVTTAFLLYQSKSPAVILTGAFVSCFIGVFFIDYLVNKTKVKEDSALAITLSLFFAIGIFQLTYIQKLPLASQAGLDKLLFGQAASLIGEDVKLLGAVALLLLLFVFVAFRNLKIITFDRAFATTIGLNIKLYEALLAISTVLAVVIGLQLVGVVLTAALVLTPAAAARYWSDDLKIVLLLAGIFGALSGVFGANISYLAPRMPTGPWMVVGISLIFFVSLVVAPRRGMFWRYLMRIKTRRKVQDENVLRTLYKIGEACGKKVEKVQSVEILKYRNMDIRGLDASLKRLLAAGMVEREQSHYWLTAIGLKRAEQLTQFHRLWEVYLAKNVQIAPDHVHADADEVEHFITPEIAQRLKGELGQPTKDPHGKNIPAVANDVFPFERKRK